MEHPGFFERAGPLTLAAIAERTAGELAVGADPGKLIGNVAALDVAGPDELSFIDNSKYFAMLARTRAGACLVAAANLAKLPAETVAVVVAEPYRAFAQALQAFYPTAMHPRVATGDASDYLGGVHRSAMLDDGVRVQPGAIVGPEAQIGRGTVIAAGAVVGYRVCIGRDGYVGPNATLVHTLAGDRVTIHGGVQCGHDGFGFAMGRRGHLKVPQVGRVIIQDDVEIGASTAIDRGALKDTVIGEGSKIDNLIQIGHNVTIGRHCVVAAHTAIAGSVTIGDFVVIGGAVAIAGHLTIGSGTQIAGRAGITNHLRPGSLVGGFPARPLKSWAREVATLKRLSARDKSE